MGKEEENRVVNRKRKKTNCIEIDLLGVSTREQFHDRVQEAMPCPVYYGRNLDALYDVLTESGAEWELVFQHCGEFERELPGYYAALRELCQEAMEECGGLKIRFQ